MTETICPTCKQPVTAGASFCSQCGSRTGAGDSRALVPDNVDVVGKLARALGAKWEVRRLLGEGGFAQVYEVWDTDLQRRLAVKVLKPDIAWSAGMLERFQQECRSLARLTHANILPIHFVGSGEGLVYYAMPFIEGESLSVLLAKGPLSLDRALGIVRPLLDALSHAHGQGLIHRDIKPDNIMLEASTGRPLLVDFGIAKRIDGEGHKTQAGFVVGTPQYMSPEQALGQGDLDARSDLYAVGAVLFQMVTGSPPFEGDTSQEIVGKHLSEPAPIATTRNARIPMWLSDIIVRCLAKRPPERFQSAAMMLDALNSGQQFGGEDSVSAERVAKRIQSDVATEMMRSAERTSASPARPVRPSPVPSPTRPVASPSATVESVPKKRGAGVLVLVVLLLLGAGGWYYLRPVPTLIVKNALVEPIRLVIGRETLDVAAGATLEHKVERGTPVVAHWYLVRPTDPAGAPLGVEVQGTITVDAPSGRMLNTIDANSSEQAVFAPLITNMTGGPISLTMNAGLVNAQPCNCRVNAGSNRARIGYYPLFRNSSVEARDGLGRVAVFRDLGPSVDRDKAAVGLRFEEKDFR
jgi:serine/threonine protein kinase